VLIYKFINSIKQNQNLYIAPKFGYLEDLATGLGNSAMGYYMLKNQLWDD